MLSDEIISILGKRSRVQMRKCETESAFKLKRNEGMMYSSDANTMTHDVNNKTFVKHHYLEANDE